MAQGAAFKLLNLLYHQGGLAAAPDAPNRRAVLELVARLASGAEEIAEKFLRASR